MAAGAVATPDAGATSMDAELGSVLTDALESVTAGEAAEQPPEPAQAASTEEAPPGEGGNGPSQPTTPPAEAPPGEAGSAAVEPYKLTSDGAAYIVPKTELPVLTGFKTYAEAVQNRFPTANDAELGYLESSDFRAMRSDYLNGQDTDIDAMLGYWAGKDHTDPQLAAQFRQSFVRMAQRVPDALKTVDEQAYSKLGDSFITSRIDSAYARAAESGDPDDLLAAQRIDWGHTGRYKTELPKHDPQVAAQAALDKQRQEVDSRQTQLLNRDWKSFNTGSLEGPKWQQFNAEVDKVLAPVKANYDSAVFEAVRERIGKQVVAKLQEDFEWARNHENDRKTIESSYKQIWQRQQSSDGLKPRIQTYTNDFMARVRRHLPSIAAPLLSKAPAKQAGVAAKPPTSPQTPVRAANGQFQPAQSKSGKREFYNIHEDPEFKSAFNIS